MAIFSDGMIEFYGNVLKFVSIRVNKTVDWEIKAMSFKQKLKFMAKINEHS